MAFWGIDVGSCSGFGAHVGSCAYTNLMRSNTYTVITPQPREESSARRVPHV